MTSKQTIQSDYRGIQLNLLDSAWINYSNIPSDDHAHIVKRFVEEEFKFSKYEHLMEWHSLIYPRESLLKLVLLGFADYGYCSLRQLEESARTNIRYMFVSDQLTPCFKTIDNFLNKSLRPHMAEIFRDLNLFIEKEDCSMDVDLLLIDGTKYEANARKFSFVWMKATEKYLVRAWEKVLRNISRYNSWLKENGYDESFSVLQKPNIEILLDLDSSINRIKYDLEIVFEYGKGKRKTELQRIYDINIELGALVYKYTEYYQLAAGRNSFSKTDPGATFMHMLSEEKNNPNILGNSFI